jgi:hypothetical protein
MPTTALSSTAREAVHHLLDLGRCDVLAAADDQLLEPSGNGDEAVFIALGEVAGVVPAGA